MIYYSVAAENEYRMELLVRTKEEIGPNREKIQNSEFAIPSIFRRLSSPLSSLSTTTRIMACNNSQRKEEESYRDDILIMIRVCLRGGSGAKKTNTVMCQPIASKQYIWNRRCVFLSNITGNSIRQRQFATHSN